VGGGGQLAELQALEHLFLSCNRLAAVPPPLATLTRLCTLDLSLNLVRGLPAAPATRRLLVPPASPPAAAPPRLLRCAPR
jgi:hypothetical protein